MAWFAPVSLNSGGLSAVKSSIGTCDILASTTDGSKLATAVPDDVITGAGNPVARENPSAQKPNERSSMQGTMVDWGCEATASASGDDLDPDGARAE